MEILIKAVAGSHLFGLNTENSDMDYKGVYIPSVKDIILGTDTGTISTTTGKDHQRNTKDDVDCQLFSLKKFMTMLDNGDTAALELLFTPDNMIIEKSPKWDKIVSLRDKLISKKTNALIGYIRQQTNKYAVVGSRLNELMLLMNKLKELEKLHPQGSKIKQEWDTIVEFVKPLNYINIIELPTKSTINPTMNPAIEVLGSKFDHHTSFSVINKWLKDSWKERGQRAREARKNNGIDRKALSHALRCIIQGKELFDTGKITLPHSGSNRELLMGIKTGSVSFDEFQVILEDKFKEFEKSVDNSRLPDKLNKDFTDDIILSFYGEVINEYLCSKL